MNIELHVEIYDTHSGDRLCDFYAAGVPRRGDQVKIADRQHLIREVIWHPTDMATGRQSVVLEVDTSQ